MPILFNYDQDLESAGVDEANLDVTQYLIDNQSNHYSGRLEVGNQIKNKIFEEMQMTCSIGIGCNKLLAKICSEQNKPNGVTILGNNEEVITKFMNTKVVRQLPGVGGVQEQLLSGLGIKTCADMIDLENTTAVYVNQTPVTFRFLIKSSMGIGSIVHENVGKRIKQSSISFSAT